MFQRATLGLIAIHRQILLTSSCRSKTEPNPCRSKTDAISVKYISVLLAADMLRSAGPIPSAFGGLTALKELHIEDNTPKGEPSSRISSSR